MRPDSMMRIAAAVLLLAPATLLAQDSKKKEAGPTSFTLKPSILDAKDGIGTVLGAEYDAKADWKYALATDRGSDIIDPNAPLFRFNATGSAKGTVAVDKKRNPKNFSEGKFELGTLYSAVSAVRYSVGANVKTKFETDQSFQNKAFVLGGGGTGSVCWGLTNAGCLVADAAYDNVDPKNDKERAAALGSKLTSFKRVNLELLYIQQLPWNVIHGLEVNYRLFQELNAPAAVEAANIDAFALTTVRLSLPSDFFVGYSWGKLPFDRKDDAIMQIGWSYKLW
jgi:hypothetical protein